MHAGPVSADGSLQEAAVELLHAVTGVDRALLAATRIRPSHSNWLRAPWYARHRGGAITVGRTIWFTAIWYDPRVLGDGSLKSTHAWLLHLAHEVGHLPQAERFGRTFTGKLRYVAAFAWQYGSRALLLKRRIHDGSTLEIEADRGRKVLRELTKDAREQHPAVVAVHEGRTDLVRAWCSENQVHIHRLRTKHEVA